VGCGAVEPWESRGSVTFSIGVAWVVGDREGEQRREG